MEGKIREIYEGWKNAIFKDEKIEVIAEQRLEICFKCPHRARVICSKCGCPLKAKARSTTSECPDKRW